MSRSEGIALGVAAFGHVVLFAILSLSWSATKLPPPVNKPIDVSLVDNVALEQTAPSAAEPPAQSAAPDAGPPEDAAPPAEEAAAAPEPEPVPVPVPKPQPKAEPKAEPKPQPKPQPKPVPQPKPEPKPVPKPVPVPKPQPKPRPEPKAEAKPSKADLAKAAQEKAAQAKAAQAKAAAAAKAIADANAAKAAAAASAAKAAAAKSAAAKGNGANAKSSKARATGSLLDDDFRKGLTQSASKAKASDAAPGATMNAQAAADIGSAIRRQVQPCADRQPNPGPGASRIIVTIRLQLNRDGSLAGRPTVAPDHGGVDDENRRYVDVVDRNAIATFTGCAPLRGLPPELYDVPRGWKTFILRYKLPG
ncbi:outer membrane biosynthesis protein TonB [Sphingomonas sp. PvP055]|uniref:cell envelope biogenesis protein TolA n=1 Tax=Sphingomonas sp. PvP055 TaxID=3156391 RepID=UPI00339450B4